jgi:hypothetical protein
MQKRGVVFRVNKSWKTKYLTAFMLAILLVSLAFPTVFTGIAKASPYPGTTVWHEPSARVNGPISQIKFHFSQDIAISTFSASDDIVAFYGPLGPLSILGFSWPGTNYPRTLIVYFPSQSETGIYCMVLGPQIIDTRYGAMDVDQDGVKGEVLDDQYMAKFIIEPLIPNVIFDSTSMARVPVNLPASLTVQVKDQYGFPAKNTVVNFGCFIYTTKPSFPGSATTDTNGYVTISVVSGTAGKYTIQAKVNSNIQDGIAQWDLTVYDIIPTLGFDSSSVPAAATNVPASLTVKVIDQYDFPVKNTAVTFYSSPAGLFLSSSGTTDANGYLSVSAVSGTPGTYTVQATTSGSSAQWSLTIYNQIPRITLVNSKSSVTVFVPAILDIQVLDQYNFPVRDSVVTFDGSPSGLSMPSSGVTDAAGYLTIQASSVTPGLYSIQVHIGESWLGWDITIVPPKVSFDSSSVPATATNVPASLTLQVTDENNFPVRDAVVTFESSPSGLTLPSSGVTDSSGYLTIQASSGTPETYSVQGNTGGKNAQWVLTVYDVIPTVSFESSSVIATAAFVPTDLWIRVTDQYEVAVKNVAVAFSSNPVGLFLSSSGTTDANGYLSVSAVSGTPGTYTVEADISGFSAQWILTIYAPVVLFDSNSESYVRASSSASLTVVVSDQYGNPVPYAPVVFSSTPEGLSLPPSTTTDYSGYVTVEACSKTAGVYTIHASVGGGSTQFILETYDPGWRDNFNYQTMQQMLDSGWDANSLSADPMVVGGFLTLTNYGSFWDAYAYYDYSNQMSVSAPYRLETRAMILDAVPNDPESDYPLDASIGPALYFQTQTHAYVWTVNYFENSFLFFRDDVLVWSSSGFDLSPNTWSVLAVEIWGNSFYLFCDNHLEGFYSDQQGTQGSLTGLALVNNRAIVEYDYVQVTCDTQGNAPILIDGDSQFTLANGVTSGTGTEADPYLLENLVIDTSYTDGSGIAIMNTNSYFVIKNCNIIHETGYSQYPTGITIINSNNGKITNTSITQQRNGIVIGGSKLNIENSVISNNFIGVNLYPGYYFLEGKLIKGSVDIHFCNIFGNSYYGLYNVNGTPVNAVNNWWGSPDGPSYGSWRDSPNGWIYIEVSSGDAITTPNWGNNYIIFFEPWLTAPLSTSSTQEGTNENLEFPESKVTAVISGSAEVNVATYASVPTEGLTDSINKYIDVYIPDTSSLTEITIKAYYTLPLPNGMSEDALVLRWYDLNQGKWVDCSETGVNKAEQFIWARINATSIPSLDDFDGTTFGIALDNSSPTTSLIIGEPKLIRTATYITPETPLTLQATDDGGSGVDVTLYRILDNSYDSGWLTYTGPFFVGNLAEGACTIEYKSLDNAGNEESLHVMGVTLSYPVAFTQTGLLTGTPWSVTFGGTTQSSTTKTITFTFITTGSYTWTASNQISTGIGTRYVTSTSSGTLNVPTQTTQSITFTPQYQVSFSLNPTGTGTISPSATNYYDSGTKVSIIANANAGYTFWQWTSNNPSITFDSVSLVSTIATINGPGTITATFATLVSGNKNIVLTGSNKIVVVSGGNNNVDCTQATSTTIVKTGSGNNIIKFGGGDNIFKATAGGNDIITTGNGNNNINIAGMGNNQITTGSGNEQIQITGNGNNIINAGGGNNIVTVSGTGNNQITAGSGDDVITVGGGNNIIKAGDGNNQVSAGHGNNQITTGSGSDTVVAGNGNNNVKTGAGDDAITVGNGNNSIDGGAGYDTCLHGTGNNTILNCEKK